MYCKGPYPIHYREELFDFVQSGTKKKREKNHNTQIGTNT